MTPLKRDDDEFGMLLEEIPRATSSPHPHDDVLDGCLHGHGSTEGRHHEKLHHGDHHFRSVSSHGSSVSLASYNGGLSIDGSEEASSPSSSVEFPASSHQQMMSGQGNQVESWFVGKNSSAFEKPNGGGYKEDVHVLSDALEKLGIREFCVQAASRDNANDLSDGFHRAWKSHVLCDEISRSLRLQCSGNACAERGDILDCIDREMSNSLQSRLNAQDSIGSLNRNCNTGGLLNPGKFSSLHNFDGADRILLPHQDGMGLCAPQGPNGAIPLSQIAFFFGDSLRYDNAPMVKRHGRNLQMASHRHPTESVPTEWAPPPNPLMIRNAQILHGFSEKSKGLLKNKDVERSQSDQWSLFLQNRHSDSNAYSKFNYMGGFIDDSFELSVVGPKYGGIPSYLRHNSAAFLPTRYNSLREIEGYMHIVAKDQQGCRFLQRMFDEGTPQEVRMIFNEIIGYAVELITDPFGNYLMQKLLEVCNELQRTQIIRVVTAKPKELANISLNMHGTRVVQKLIATLKTPLQISMVVSSLEPWTVNLIKDLNGNHVIQCCLQCLSIEDNMFLFDASANHCVEIATHRHGCCVLQRCVGRSTGMRRQTLIAEIAANALVLSQDPFGNYVIQNVLGLKIHWATACIVSQLQGNFVDLSMQKFSSNVVEKCLKEGGEPVGSTIIRELVSSSRFEHLLQDQFANYVIQSALAESKGAVHTALLEVIRPAAPALRSNPYGKRILSRIHSKK